MDVETVDIKIKKAQLIKAALISIPNCKGKGKLWHDMCKVSSKATETGYLSASDTIIQKNQAVE